MSAEIQIWVFCDKTRLYPFQESYSVTGIESTSFDDAMRLPEWVNIKKGARQSTPQGGVTTLPQEVYSVCFQQYTGYFPTHLQQIIKVTNKKVLGREF